MELQAVNALLGIMPLHRGNGRIVGVRDGAKAWRHPLDAISVRHPNNRRTTRANALEQVRPIIEAQLSPAELSVLRLFPRRHPEGGSPAACHSRCQESNALLEQLLGDLGAFIVDARGSAGKHDALWDDRPGSWRACVHGRICE